MSLLELIQKPSEAFDGKLGISVKNLDSGEAASLNGGELFPTASVFKVPVIVELHRQVDAGRIDLDEKITLMEEDKVPGSGILRELGEGLELSVRDLIELMMILSDNTATDLLTERVGIDNVNATLRDLGLEKTRVVADCRDILFDLIGLGDLPDEEKTIGLYRERVREGAGKGTWSLGTEENDVTTPDEMLKLIEMIHEGEAASRESCDAILATMRRCQTGGYRIAKYLPRSEIDFAHKTGSLPGIRNDVGIVTVRETGESYIISCFTKGVADVFAAEEVIAQSSKNVYEHFTK
jgi:beta-lactamase class A